MSKSNSRGGSGGTGVSACRCRSGRGSWPNCCHRKHYGPIIGVVMVAAAREVKDHRSKVCRACAHDSHRVH